MGEKGRILTAGIFERPDIAHARFAHSPSPLLLPFAIAQRINPQRLPRITMIPERQNLASFARVRRHIMDCVGRCCAIKAKESIRVVVYAPAAPEKQRELMALASAAHADAVVSRIRNLNCPAQQKAELIGAVIETVKRQRG